MKLLSTRARHRWSCAVAVLSALLIGGCSSVGAPQHSDTLSAYDQLAVQPDGVRSWRLAGAPHYRQVCVAAEQIAFGAAVALDASEQQALRDALRTALGARLAEAGMKVSSATPCNEGLKLRSTITATQRTSPGVNVLTTVLLLAPLSRGGLSVELEALDVEGGQRVAAMAFTGRAGIEDLATAFSALGHARAQLDMAATRFAALVAGAPLPAAQPAPLPLDPLP